VPEVLGAALVAPAAGRGGPIAVGALIAGAAEPADGIFELPCGDIEFHSPEPSPTCANLAPRIDARAKRRRRVFAADVYSVPRRSTSYFDQFCAIARSHFSPPRNARCPCALLLAGTPTHTPRTPAPGPAPRPPQPPPPAGAPHHRAERRAAPRCAGVRADRRAARAAARRRRPRFADVRFLPASSAPHRLRPGGIEGGLGCLTARWRRQSCGSG
jgi:hypothetical protein